MAHQRGWDYLRFHHKPCRGFQDLQELTESLACQEIQARPDPPAIQPTLGWVFLPNRNQTSLLWRFELFHTFLSDGFRSTWCRRWRQVSMRSPVWPGWCQDQGWATQKKDWISDFKWTSRKQSVWLLFFQGEAGPRGLPGPPGSPVSKDSMQKISTPHVRKVQSQNPDFFLLFRAQLVVRDFQERLETPEQWWENSLFYLRVRAALNLWCRTEIDLRVVVVLRASRVFEDQTDHLENLDLMWVKQMSTPLQF